MSKDIKTLNEFFDLCDSGEIFQYTLGNIFAIMNILEEEDEMHAFMRAFDKAYRRDGKDYCDSNLAYMIDTHVPIVTEHKWKHVFAEVFGKTVKSVNEKSLKELQ